MSTLSQTRKMLSAFKKKHPELKGVVETVATNLRILASDADEDTKADAFRVLPANVERFRQARNGGM